MFTKTPSANRATPVLQGGSAIPRNSLSPSVAHRLNLAGPDGRVFEPSPSPPFAPRQHTPTLFRGIETPKTRPSLTHVPLSADSLFPRSRLETSPVGTPTRSFESSKPPAAPHTVTVNVSIGKRKRADRNKGLVLEQDAAHFLEAVGAYPEKVWSVISALPQPLPEKLVSVDSRGWIVCVIANQVFIWKNRTTTADSSFVPSAMVLSLPDEAIGTPSTLVRVLESVKVDGSIDGPQAILVSPTGSVLFWADVKPHLQTAPVQLQLVLGEREIITHLTPLGSIGVLCATSQSNVWLVGKSGSVVKARIFQRKEGILGTIGKFFGLSAAAPRTKRTMEIAAVSQRKSSDSGPHSAYQLTEDSLIKWTISTSPVVEGSRDGFEWEAPLHSRVKEQLLSEYYGSDPSDEDACSVWLLSIHVVSERNVVLLAASLFHRTESSTPRLLYTLHQIILKPSASQSDVDSGYSSAGGEPLQLGDFIKLDYQPPFREEHLDGLLAVELLRIPGPRSNAGVPIYIVWTLSNPLKIAGVLLTPRVEDRRMQVFDVKYIESSKLLGVGVMTARSSVMLFASSMRRGVLSATATCTLSREGDSDQSHVSSSTLAPFTTTSNRGESDVASPDAMAVDAPTTISSFVQHLKTQFKSFCAAAYDGDAPSGGVFGSLSADESTFPTLEQAILLLSGKLIDAKPSAGQRWAEDPEGRSSLSEGGVSTQLVRYHLDDKRKQHSKFLEFLQEHPDGVWRCLSVHTQAQLQQHEEKLEAAVAICQLQDTLLKKRKRSSTSSGPNTTTGPRSLLLQAMLKSVLSRGYSEEHLRLAGLSVADAFFAEVSKLQDLFPFLHAEVSRRLEDVGAKVATSLTPTEDVIECNEVFINALEAIHHASNESRSDRFESSASSASSAFSDWVNSEEFRGISRRQVEYTMGLLGYQYSEDRCIRRVRAGPTAKEVEEQLYCQLEKLGELVLELFEDVCRPDGQHQGGRGGGGAAASRASISTSALLREFHATKGFVIDPLVSASRLISSQSLAERFAYFEALVQLCLVEDERANPKIWRTICDDIENYSSGPGSERLLRYCEDFRDQGFTTFLFQWLSGEKHNPWATSGSMSKQRLALLLSRPENELSELQSYLETHTKLRKLLWINNIQRDQYRDACGSLVDQGSTEVVSAALKKTMLSLGKLSALAASHTEDLSNEISSADVQLGLLAIQDAMARTGVINDVDFSAPFAPENLISIVIERIRLFPRAVAPSLGAISQADALMFTLEAYEDMLRLGYSQDDIHPLLLRIWTAAFDCDQQQWDQIARLHMSSEATEVLEGLLRLTLLHSVALKYSVSLKDRVFDGTGSLSEAVISGMFEGREQAVRLRQLSSMALNLARSDSSRL